MVNHRLNFTLSLIKFNFETDLQTTIIFACKKWLREFSLKKDSARANYTTGRAEKAATNVNMIAQIVVILSISQFVQFGQKPVFAQASDADMAGTLPSSCLCK